MSDKELILQLVSSRYTVLSDAITHERQARRLRDSVKHLTLKDIADKFEVSESYVSRIAREYGLEQPRRG